MKKTIYFLFTKSVGLYINFLSFLVPEKPRNLRIRYLPRDGKLSKKSFEVLQTEKRLTNTKTFSNVHLERNDTIIL
jgi:hypothetical protein